MVAIQITSIFFFFFFREIEQAENVKPKSRSRLQRPKPNLSRAVGKKSVVSQDKQDERSKVSPSEASVEKVWPKRIHGNGSYKCFLSNVFK